MLTCRNQCTYTYPTAAMSGALQDRMQRMMRRIGPKFKFADGWFDSFRWLQGAHPPLCTLLDVALA